MNARERLNPERLNRKPRFISHDCDSDHCTDEERDLIEAALAWYEWVDQLQKLSDAEVRLVNAASLARDVWHSQPERSTRDLPTTNLREIDAQVAERVMGEPMPPVPVGCDSVFKELLSPLKTWVHIHLYDHGDECEWVPVEFSTDPRAMMLVIERIRELGWAVTIESVEGNDDVRWRAGFFRDRFHVVGDEFLPLAICKAALSAINSAKEQS